MPAPVSPFCAQHNNCALYRSYVQLLMEALTAVLISSWILTSCQTAQNHRMMTNGQWHGNTQMRHTSSSSRTIRMKIVPNTANEIRIIPNLFRASSVIQLSHQPPRVTTRLYHSLYLLFSSITENRRTGKMKHSAFIWSQITSRWQVFQRSWPPEER